METGQRGEGSRGTSGKWKGDWVIAKTASKELDDLPENVIERVDREILSLANEPRPRGCKKLRNHLNTFRLGVDDYRIVYFIDDRLRLIRILAVKHRKGV